MALNTTDADHRLTFFAGMLSGCYTDADHPDINTIDGGNSADVTVRVNRPSFRWRASRVQTHWTRNWTTPTDNKRPMPVTGVTTLDLTGQAVASAESWGTATVTGGSGAHPTATVIIMG